MLDFFRHGKDMDWFIRFTLGLKARPEDVKALREVLPELRNSDLQFERRRYFWIFDADFHTFHTNEELLEALRQWALEVESPDDHWPQDHRNCPSNNCPLRHNQARKAIDGEPFIAQFMVAAGGPDAKPPKQSFFDLVRRTHPQSDPPREVILTDPYIYSDVSEDGKEGGFSNLVAYLETLGLSSDDLFTLRMTPSPKRGTITAKKNLHRHLKTKFKNIQFKDYSPQLKFHDRFYVVRHRSGVIKGVFGPSINGLTSDAIVLMGDIDDLQPLKKLESWFG
jgi:hypothetical protein